MSEHIFIIRVWHEHRDLGHTQSVLRSVIQHVPSKKKSLLSEFNSILEFAMPYLQDTVDPIQFRNKQIDINSSHRQLLNASQGNR